MIVDTSAIIAILKREPEADRLLAALDTASNSRMSTPTYLECFAVLRKAANPALDAKAELLLAEAGIVTEAFTDEMAVIARRAYREFGRGSGHPARLNFGDCFSYALAIHSGEPLLWKGDDFTHTGITSAIAL